MLSVLAGLYLVLSARQAPPTLHVDAASMGAGSIDFSSDCRWMLCSRPDKIKNKWTWTLWEVASGKPTSVVTADATGVPRLTGDGESVLYPGVDGHYVIADSITGRVKKSLGLTGNDIRISRDGKYCAVTHGTTIDVVEVSNGKTIQTLDLGDLDTSASFAPNSSFLAVVCGGQKRIVVFDLVSRKERIVDALNINTRGSSQQLERSFFSPDSRYQLIEYCIFNDGEDRPVRAKLGLYDFKIGHLARIFDDIEIAKAGEKAPWFAAPALQNDLQKRVDREQNGRVNLLYGRKLKSFLSAPDGKSFVISSLDGLIVHSVIPSFEKMTEWEGIGLDDGYFAVKIDRAVDSARITPDNKRVIATCTDGSVRIFDMKGNELCQLVNYDDGSFAVVDQDGRFDASDGGNISGAYWTIANENVGLDRLKDGYFDPGLLAKKLGFSDEPLRRVSPIGHLKLSPKSSIVLSADKSSATIQVVASNGGIGIVQVFLNGQLIVERQAPKDKQDKWQFSINLADENIQKRLLPKSQMKEGDANQFEVIAFNNEGNIASRSVHLKAPEPESKAVPPKLFAIVAGTNYAGKLQLTYAQQDAEVLSKAIERAGRACFNKPAAGFPATERVHVKTLLGGADTPEALRAALKEVAASASASDIVIVYLSGHGVQNAKGKSGYFYLTDSASGQDIEQDEPAGYAISGDEIGALMAKIPASHQALILDTCASGAAATEISSSSKNVSSDLKRSWERLKDRAGVFVLAGCAGDRVSYEATTVGHGLLTYALLEPLNDVDPAVLRREGGSLLIDIEAWLRHAEDRVPQLVRELDLGGIQRPEMKAKAGARTFDVGVVAESDRGQLHLSDPKVVLLFDFFEDDGHRDPLDINKAVKERLLAMKETASFAYWPDVRFHHNAFRLVGGYQVKDSLVTVTVFLQRYGDDSNALTEVVKLTLPAESKLNASDLADKIVKAIEPSLERARSAARSTKGL